MATVDDLGDTYDLPNFVGDIYSLYPNETPFLTMMGVNAMGGGQVIDTYNITWQDYTNDAPAQLGIVEGADPDYKEQPRAERENVTMIFQRGVELSYTKHSAVGKIGPFSTRVWGNMGNQPVQDEDAFQIKATLDNIKRNMNWHAWNSAYALGTTNSTARQTRGFLNAVTTNKVDNFTTSPDTTPTFDFTGGALEDLWTVTAHALVVGDEVQFTAAGSAPAEYAADTPYWVVTVNDANTIQLSATKGGAVLAGTADTSGTWTLQKSSQLTRANIEELVRTMRDAATPAPLRQPVFFCGSTYTLQRISELYGFAPQSRTLGGVAVTDILLDGAGTVPIVFDRDLPSQVLALADMSVIEPHWLRTVVRGEDKGLLFYEDIAHTGAATRGHIYGDMGFAWGPEGWHGWIEGLTTVP